jgi:hypothetical protein
MIRRGAEEEVPEPLDLEDIRSRYDRLIGTMKVLESKTHHVALGDMTGKA